MPYIVQEKRDQLDPAIDQLHEALVKLATDDENNNFEGNINYTVTRLIQMCYDLSYADVNAVIGVLECIKLEHYRKIAAPYEDQKEFDNGAVDATKAPMILNEVVVENDD